MSLMDKAMFWKKKEEDFGDFSDLGSFGIDTKSVPSTPEKDPFASDMGSLPPMDDAFKTDFNTLDHREEVQPTSASKNLSEQFNTKPAQPTGFPASQGQPMHQMQTQPMQQQLQTPPQQQYPQQYAPQYQPQFHPQMNSDISDLPKDIEIIHAKLDAIKSSLDSINQRLATLERIASGEPRNKYAW